MSIQDVAICRNQASRIYFEDISGFNLFSGNFNLLVVEDFNCFNVLIFNQIFDRRCGFGNSTFFKHIPHKNQGNDGCAGLVKLIIVPQHIVCANSTVDKCCSGSHKDKYIHVRHFIP
ncbi:hypothetical protein D3C81_1683410 [compost metagenome]